MRKAAVDDDRSEPQPPPLTPFPPDLDATWEYWSPFDSAEVGVPDEWVWERLRNRRDQLLAASDHRVLGDVPWDIKPWIEYRAALRDLPDNTDNPRQANWPTPPAEREEN